MVSFICNIDPPRGPKFADKMLFSYSFIEPIVDNVLDLETSRVLPKLTDMCRYYIYSLTRDMKSHGNSLIFKTAQFEYFVIELTCNFEIDRRPRLYLTVEPFIGNVEELFYRGRIWETGLGLVYSALNLVDRLGSYFQFRFNAMHFAGKFLTILGLGYYRLLKDDERVLLIVFGYSVAEIFLDLYFKKQEQFSRHYKVYMSTQIKTIERAYF